MAGSPSINPYPMEGQARVHMCVCGGGGLPSSSLQEAHVLWDVQDGGGPAPTLTGTCPHPQIIAFDELRTDFKNPIDQGNPARAVSDTCAVLRCVRLFVFLSWVEGGNGGSGRWGCDVEGR